MKIVKAFGVLLLTLVQLLVSEAIPIEQEENKLDLKLLNDALDYLGSDNFQKLASALPDVDLRSLIMSTFPPAEAELNDTDMDNPDLVQENSQQQADPAQVNEPSKDKLEIKQSTITSVESPNATISYFAFQANALNESIVATSTIQEESTLTASLELSVTGDLTNSTHYKSSFDPVDGEKPLEALFFPWKKKKDDDCDDEDEDEKENDDCDGSDKVVYIKLDVETLEPHYFKETMIPSQVNQSSILDWFWDLIDDCKEEENENERGISVHDENGEVIFIALTNNNLTASDIVKNFGQVETKANMIYMSVDESNSVHSYLVPGGEVNAQTSLRQAVENIKYNNKEGICLPKSNDSEECEKMIFVSWNNTTAMAAVGTVINSSETITTISNPRETEFIQNVNENPSQGKHHNIFHRSKNQDSVSYGFHRSFKNQLSYMNSANGGNEPTIVALVVFMVSCMLLL